MKALITAAFHEDGLEILKGHMDVLYESWKEKGKIYTDTSEFINKIKREKADVLIVEVDTVDEDVLSACDVKIIGSCRANPVNVEVDAATEHGIPVFYTPGRNADAVADMTIALMLAQIRHLTEVDRVLKSGEFFINTEEDFKNFLIRFSGPELGGKNVGIIGMGAVGFKVAQRLRHGFGAKILVYDPYVKEERLKAVEATAVDLETLLKGSDLVTLHVSVTPETEGMIGEKEFALMKPTAYFFNTARAFATDEDALYKALKDNRIAGAGLDVFDVEPVDSDNRFLELDNVTVTPHIAGQTVDVVRHQAMMIAEDIARYLTGEEPLHIKNPEVLKRAR
ncbi:MAG TPA: 2-hydroxyacid dehydrogenase [Thermoplasmata archaeon]|nr:2-hydroxyacid dehydrogenase [Thermoplasmata archaeon]